LALLDLPNNTLRKRRLGCLVILIEIKKRALCSSPGRGPDFALFLLSQLLQLLRPPKKKFAVRFIVGSGGVPLALAGVF
jgi:hypothetical protein